jgi:hypothetical protein
MTQTMLKPGGLLARTMKFDTGTCETCGNLVQVSETAVGCAAHDKLILPNFPPYSGKAKCKDWQERAAEAMGKHEPNNKVS